MNDPCTQYLKELKEFEINKTVLECEDCDYFLYHLMDCKKCRDTYISIQAPIDEDLRKYYANYENMKVLKTIGFWKASLLDSSVDPCNLPIDENLDPRVINYLQSAHVYSMSPGYSFCRFYCGISDYGMGSCEYYDGVYMWPEGLLHYLRNHKIQLPEYFLEYIASNNYQVPEIDKDSKDYRICSEEWTEWGSRFQSVKTSSELKAQNKYLGKITCPKEKKLANAVFSMDQVHGEFNAKKFTEALQWLKYLVYCDGYEDRIPAANLLMKIYEDPYEGWEMDRDEIEVKKWFEYAKSIDK